MGENHRCHGGPRARSKPHARSISLVVLIVTLAQLFFSEVLGKEDFDGVHALPSIMHVPSFTYDEIIQERPLEASTRTAFLDAVNRVGMLAVDGVPNLGKLRSAALSEFASCATKLGKSSPKGTKEEHDLGDAREVIREFTLDDGVVRKTVATATRGLDEREPLPERLVSHCGEAGGAMDLLRKAVGDVNAAFVRTLDGIRERERAASGSHYRAKPLLEGERGAYYSLESVLSDRETLNLEHFHLYTQPLGGDNNPVGNLVERVMTETVIGAARTDGSDVGKGIITERSSPSSLNLHLDVGLYIAFTPAISSSMSYADGSGFLARPPSASGMTNEGTEPQPVPVRFPSGGNCVVFMFGYGAAHWLDWNLGTSPGSAKSASPDSLVSPRPVPHALQVDLKEGEQWRGWYGVMNLVPTTAYLGKGTSVTLSQLRERAVHVAKDHKHANRAEGFTEVGDKHIEFGQPLSISKSSLPNTVGCSDTTLEETRIRAEKKGFQWSSKRLPTRSLPSSSEEERRSLALALTNTATLSDACNNNTYYCWMMCQPIPEYPPSTYGSLAYSLHCLDDSIVTKKDRRDHNVSVEVFQEANVACSQAGVSGAAMNAHCKPMWMNIYGTDPDAKASYCISSTDMYMGGFTWKGMSCVVLLFPSIVLNTETRFIGGCIATLFMGIIAELIIARRRDFLRVASTFVRRRQLQRKRGVHRHMNSGTIAADFFDFDWQVSAVRIVCALFYAVQLTMGYFIMLVVMTYSTPLFISVILGLVLGHLMFNQKLGKPSKKVSFDGGCEKQANVGLFCCPLSLPLVNASYVSIFSCRLSPYFVFTRWEAFLAFSCLRNSLRFHNFPYSERAFLAPPETRKAADVAEEHVLP